MTYFHHCCKTSPFLTNRSRIVVALVDKRLCVFNREAGNQAMVQCQSKVKFIDRWNSSVTHDIAKVDNYSVYRRLGGNLEYLMLLSTNYTKQTSLSIQYSKLEERVVLP